MILHFLEIMTTFLIPFMLILLTFSLFLRAVIYKDSKSDLTYFSSFSKLVEKYIQTSHHEDINKLGSKKFIFHMMEDIEDQLPLRGVRIYKKKSKQNNERTLSTDLNPLDENKENKENNEHNENESKQRIFTMREYMSSGASIVYSIKNEVNAFNSHHPPNFSDLTRRVLNKDINWTRVMKIFPVENVMIFLDMMPSIFIVLGIFGTFIGITLALPQIANIDFSQIDASSGVLSDFIKDITFSMESSICGIFCSLILTILNAIYPVSFIRSNITEEFESCLEHMWFFIQDAKKSLSSMKDNFK